MGPAGGADRGHPDEPWRAVTVGRGERFGIARAIVGPVPPERPRAVLAELVALRAEGLCAPLPLSTSPGRLRPGHRRGGAGGRGAGRGGQGVDERGRVGERADPAHERVWGRAHPRRCCSGEPGRRRAGEPTRFGALALGLWSPLLQVEDVVRR